MSQCDIMCLTIGGNMNNTALKLELSLEQTVETYLEIQNKIKDLKSELSICKATIEEATIQSPDNLLILGPYKIKLSESTRNNFQLKDARQKLGDSILEPFTKLVHFTRLTVSNR